MLRRVFICRTVLRISGEIRGVTILFVTHDIQEAVYLGEEIAVMGADGAILQRFANPLDHPRTPENSEYPELYRKIFQKLSSEESIL